MAQTFDIRFARSGGIAALFDAAGNSFGWKGSGRLSIDAQGMSFALQRGVTTLLARRRTQRIAAETIQEIYREGDALRVEFASAGNSREVLPFWASSRESAAQIVQLAPTSRTFEVEDGPTESPGKRDGGARWAAPAGAILALAAVALVFLASRPAAKVDAAIPAVAPPASPAARVAPPAAEIAPVGGAEESGSPAMPGERIDTGEPITPEQARKLAILAEEPVDWTRPPAESAGAMQRTPAASTPPSATSPALDDEGFVPMEVPEPELAGDDAVERIAATTLAHGAARELLASFTADAAGLARNFSSARARFDAGDLQAHAFADQLDALAASWVSLNGRLLQDRKYADPALDGLRATLLSALIRQRLFLTGYGAGLRNNDQAAIERAFLEQARAGQLMQRARRYVD
jgi:hypothetical protein